MRLKPVRLLLHRQSRRIGSKHHPSTSKELSYPVGVDAHLAHYHVANGPQYCERHLDCVSVYDEDVQGCTGDKPLGLRASKQRVKTSELQLSM